jgi:2-keto-3-deoxy-6-phosphogluconate aldolase
MEYTFEQLATKRRQLAVEYKAKMQELAEIKKKKAIEIIKLLDEHKTVSKAELYYQATDDGQKEIEITLYCKGLLELMRSIKTECDIKNSEAYSQY